MDIIPEITMFFKVGIVGMADEVFETVTIKIDPNLSEEENLKALAAKGQIFQAKIQISMAELMLEKFPAFIDQKMREQGLE